MKDIPARTSLVAEQQLRLLLPEAPHQLRHLLRGVGDFPVVAHLSALGIGDGYGDGFFVDIQSDVLAKIVHGLPPLITALSRLVVSLLSLIRAFKVGQAPSITGPRP
jgi:hypothetical protein